MDHKKCTKKIFFYAISPASLNSTWVTRAQHLKKTTLFLILKPYLLSLFEAAQLLVGKNPHLSQMQK